MSNQNLRNVSSSRFELEENGETAYLEFEVDSAGWITLLHTEVPEALRGRGVSRVYWRRRDWNTHATTT